MKLAELNNIINNSKTIFRIGRITEIIGLTIVAEGIKGSIGDLCYIIQEGLGRISAEIVGFKKEGILLMPLSSLRLCIAHALCLGALAHLQGTTRYSG